MKKNNPNMARRRGDFSPCKMKRFWSYKTSHKNKTVFSSAGRMLNSSIKNGKDIIPNAENKIQPTNWRNSRRMQSKTETIHDGRTQEDGIFLPHIVRMEGLRAALWVKTGLTQTLI